MVNMALLHKGMSLGKRSALERLKIETRDEEWIFMDFMTVTIGSSGFWHGLMIMMMIGSFR